LNGKQYSKLQTDKKLSVFFYVRRVPPGSNGIYQPVGVFMKTIIFLIIWYIGVALLKLANFFWNGSWCELEITVWLEPSIQLF